MLTKLRDTSFKDLNLCDKDELLNVKNILKLEKSVERLYNSLGHSFKKKPTMLIGSYYIDNNIIHIMRDNKNIYLPSFDNYYLSGVALSKNNKIYFQFYNPKNDLIRFYQDKKIEKLIRKINK